MATRRKLSYSIARVVLGGLLFIAAMLKAEQVARGDELSLVIVGAVALEFILAAWLISGVRQRVGWYVATLTFASFAVVSFAKVIGGETECGCLGAFSSPPWVSLTIDVAALSLLFYTGRQALGDDVQSERLSPWRLATVGLCAAFALHFCTKQFVMIQSGEVLADGLLFRGDYVIADPTAWLGRPFPFLEYLDVGNDLRSGEKTVIFYRPDCPKCDSLLRKIGRAEARGALKETVLVCVARGPDSDQSRSWSRIGRLPESHKWVIDTPMVVEIRDGLVVSVVGPGA